MGRLLRRFRPPGGWALLLFLLTAILSPVATLAEMDWDLNLAVLTSLALGAVFLGLGLARSRLKPWKGIAMGFASGLLAVAALLGRILPPLNLLWSEISHSIAWYRSLQAGIPRWPLPGFSTLLALGQRVREFSLRIDWWRQTFATGGAAQDPLILNIILALLIWASAFFAAWQIYRRRAALVGLLPSGLLVATLAFFSDPIAVFYLLLYLLSTLCLVAACHLWSDTERWERAGTDYPGGLGLELTLALSPWLLAIMLLAALFPVIRPRQISDAFWRLADEPWSRLVTFSERVVGPLEGSSPRGGGSGMAGAMPNAHLLGAVPELLESPVFYVKTNDQPPAILDQGESAGTGPRRYWRAATYDLYTSKGWETSPLEGRSLPPGSRLSPTGDRVVTDNQVDTDYLVQSFVLMATETNLLYAANTPLQIDQATETWWRTGDDLAWLTSDARQYTVVSHTPQPTMTDLRTARARLPGALSERYLALPEALPQRVRDLTDQIIAGANTDWERAYRLESFLRTYPYTLDVPEPPKNRDVVDYFLFELQEGYCDYYATAMAVMARAAGLPARLASGYAQGTYSPDDRQWIVTGKDAHSWVEIFFEGIGWVEFEPTAGQPSLVRPGSERLAIVPAPPLPARSARPPMLFGAVLLAAGMLTLLALITFLWFGSRRSEPSSPRTLIHDRYARLTRWGTRLGAPLHDGQTPQEFGRALASALQARGHKARWVRLQRSAEQASPEVRALTEAFTRAQYSAESIPERQGWQIHDLWLRLRRRLRLLWLSRR